MPERPQQDEPRPGTPSLRRHVIVVATCVVLGAVAGWVYLDRQPTVRTSSARVLVNPATGNPFSPTPASVRQDEATSLETEALMVRSAEVLDAVADVDPSVSPTELLSRLDVTVLPNTQVLEISWSSTDPAAARDTTDAIARAYLQNRQERVDEVLGGRLARLESQTTTVVEDLRAATTAAQSGRAADRAFQAELADALRNELVNLRAQRTLLENSGSPVGRVISPATAPTGPGVIALAVPVAAGALSGLALGGLLAMALERVRRRRRPPTHEPGARAGTPTPEDAGRRVPATTPAKVGVNDGVSDVVAPAEASDGAAPAGGPEAPVTVRPPRGDPPGRSGASPGPAAGRRPAGTPRTKTRR